THALDIAARAGIALDRTACVRGAHRCGRWNVQRTRLGPEVVEDPTCLLRHLTNDFRDPFAEGDPAPLSERFPERYCRIARAVRPTIIARHILGPLARQGANELAPVGKVFTTIMKLHTITVARQGNIGTVPIH